jgi:thioredoxin-like negative regulator of GroEL
LSQPKQLLPSRKPSWQVILSGINGYTRENKREAMRVEPEQEKAERTDNASPQRTRQLPIDVERVSHWRLWPGGIVVIIAVSAIALLLGAVLFNYSSKLYRDWRETRLVHRATALLEEGKLSKAAEIAHELLRRRSDSLPALYVLAETAEKQNLEEAVFWRQQITRLLPTNLDSELNLASAGLRFGKLDVARQALERVPPTDRDRAAFHVVAGWLARAEGNFAEQEEQFGAAVEKEPKNDLYQFNLAALQIHSRDSEKSAKARDTLQRLSQLADYRTGALRALLNDAVTRNDLVAADNFAQQLQMSSEVTFGDYLLCLKLYRKLDEKKFRVLLDRVKPFAARDPADLASLIDWMNQNGLAGDVVKWIEKLPPPLLSSPATVIAIADAYAMTKNWSRLRRWTRTGMWGESEYLRFAYQALATQKSRPRNTATLNPEFEALWHNAVQTADEQTERELAIARLASKWELDTQSEELWWRLSETPATRREALENLRKLYRGKNKTAKLYHVLQRLHESSPNEAPITADLARLGLNVGQETERSYQLAKEAYDRAPKEVNCAVTYAFALSRLGRNSEALAIIQSLPSEQLHDPHAAVYVALLFAEENESEAANDYIAAADDEQIYPEERPLLDEAKTKLAAASAVVSPTISPVPAEVSPKPTPSLR